MQEKDKFEKRDDLFSQVVRAGKRTYFFDVKATRANQQYLTITESKRRFSEEQGKFFYEKHKIFLYKVVLVIKRLNAKLMITENSINGK